MQALPTTGEAFAVLPGQDENATPLAAVLVKRTYSLTNGQPPQRVEPPEPLIANDRYYHKGDPRWTSVYEESDLRPYKPSVDVVVLGKAFPPGGQPATQVDVAVAVGERLKIIRVFGDRRCRYRRRNVPEFTDPQPFTEMEIRYERAYGGCDWLSDPLVEFIYPRNPIGIGIAVKNVRRVVEGLPVPNLEDPNDLLTPERILLGHPRAWVNQPLPQGFGWFHRSWYPRYSFAGIAPPFIEPTTVLPEERLGWVPDGHLLRLRDWHPSGCDLRFNNGASAGLALPTLADQERFRIVNMTLDGLLAFTLPDERPRIGFTLGSKECELAAVLQTVCVKVDDRKLNLVWRGVYRDEYALMAPDPQTVTVTIF